MPTLSKQYALLDFDPGNPLSVPVEPISVDVTVDETWAPYCQATVVIQNDIAPYELDPRYAVFLGLRLQQDFGDLIYNKELTSSYGGSVAAITAQYSALLATNYIKNPTFNTGTTDWVASGSTISRDTATYYSGVASLKVVCTGTSSNQGTYKSNSAVSGLATGQKFSSSAWVKAPAGALMEIVCASQGAGAANATASFTGTGAWQYVKVESATLGASLNPYVVIRTRLTAQAITFYVDNVMLNIGTTVKEYFDGNTTDTPEITYAWTGTADNSASIKYDPVRPVEITRDFTKPWNIFETALPLSTVTAAYGGDVSNLTAADLMEVWRMSDFLHSSGTFNPAPSTIFDGYLMLRSVTKDYVSGQTTLELTSHEAILQDSIGYPTDLFFSFTSLRDIINYVLADTIGVFTQLQPGTADWTYSPAYVFKWLPNQTAWDILNALVTAANLVLYCDEAGDWFLVEATSVSGDLYLKDDDNITMLSSRIDRNSNSFFDYAVVEYQNTGSLPVYKNFGVSGFPISKDRYFLVENVTPPAAPANAAQAMVWRAVTRGITYNVEAINNFDARPRQNMTIDVTGEPVKTAVIQSISWALPSARMSVDIRDLQEV